MTRHCICGPVVYPYYPHEVIHDFSVFALVPQAHLMVRACVLLVPEVFESLGDFKCPTERSIIFFWTAAESKKHQGNDALLARQSANSVRIKPSHGLFILMVATMKINGACEGLILIRMVQSEFIFL